MIRSLTHPDTHPDSSEKHNSRAKFKDEINIHKLSKGGLKGYKIRWWQNGKRKEAYRRSYEDAVAFRCDITEKVLFGSPKTFKKTHPDAYPELPNMAFYRSVNPIYYVKEQAIYR